MIGRISLISTVGSNGWCYTAAVKGTVDSERICEYINNLTRHIKIIHRIRNHKFYFLLDNWAIHKSNKVMTLMRELNVKWAFLQLYCLELAPVELLFGQLKNKFSNSSKSEVINLNKEEDTEKLLSEIKRWKANRFPRFGAISIANAGTFWGAGTLSRLTISFLKFLL